MLLDFAQDPDLFSANTAAVERAVDDALAVPRRVERRDRLATELACLERLQGLAHASPELWLQAAQPRSDELGLWLFGVAVGVAALGLADEALALLDVLPGVAGGGRGRRALLLELLGDETGPLARAC